MDGHRTCFTCDPPFSDRDVILPEPRHEATVRLFRPSRGRVTDSVVRGLSDSLEEYRTPVTSPLQTQQLPKLPTSYDLLGGRRKG